MAARKNRINSEQARQKIRATQLIHRLQKNARGTLKPPLTMGQIRSIEILLKKIVPDLVQADVNADVTHSYVVEVPPLLTRDEWQKKYRLTHNEPKTIEHKTIDLTPEPRLITTTKQ